MTSPSCSVWILVARTDLPFLMHTLPHLMKMSNFPFQERVLAMDTAPLTGDKVNRPGIGTLEELRDRTAQLLQDGIVDRVVEINYDPDYRDQVYRKHFGTTLRWTHNYKGYPILGTIFTIEECQSDYMLHFDSDMLMYQHPDYSWITEAIALTEKHPEVMSFRPLTGPPQGEGKMVQNYPYQEHPDGFYTFKFFGSRVYLINRKRFDELLPLPLIWRPYRQKIVDSFPLFLKNSLHNLTGKGKIDSWEIMVSQKLEQSQYVRGVLANPKAWTLHPIDRSPGFIQALPQIIERIEAGDYPTEQAGHYDLIPELWY